MYITETPIEWLIFMNAIFMRAKQANITMLRSTCNVGDYAKQVQFLIPKTKKHQIEKLGGKNKQ